MRASALFGPKFGFFEIYSVSVRIRVESIIRDFVRTSFMEGHL